jgi:hypothetical protein
MKLLILGIVLAVGLSGLQKGGKAKQGTLTSNQPPVIKSFTSSLTTVELCPFSSFFNRTQLQTEIACPNCDLTYTYVVEVGSIEGTGPNVVWNLRAQPPGMYLAEVIVEDKKGNKSRAAVTVRTVESGACDPPPPPCPVVTVECPSEIERGKPLTYIANVVGGEPFRVDSYMWTTDPPLKLDGQNTKNLTIATQPLSVEKVTATVSVGGFDPSCTGTQASCTISIKSGP